MKRKIFERLRNLWLETQLLAPPWMQRAVIEPLHQARRAARLLARPYLPIVHWQGQSHGGPLSVAFSGCDDAGPFLKHLLFTAPPAEKTLGRIPLWQGERLTTLPADLVIVEADKSLIRRFARQATWVMPPRVEFHLDIQGDWRDVELRISRSVRRNEFRLMRRYGLEYEISRDEGAFETFYSDMYVPTMIREHQELAALVSRSEAHLHFRRGFLVKIIQDGDWIAGGVCQIRRDTVTCKLLGARDLQDGMLRQGAQAAVYYGPIHWANQRGFKSVGFEGSRPYLNGLFYYKRKWGTAINVPPHQYEQIWLRVRNPSPAVRQFFQDNPCIVLDAQEKLYALVVTADADEATPEMEAECHKRYMTPGLSGLLIRPAAQLFAAQPVEESVF